MRTTSVKFLLLITLLTAGSCLRAWPAVDRATLKSPDGNIEISFYTDEENKLKYEVSYNGKHLISPSALGLELQNGLPLGDNVVLTNATQGSGEDNYTLVTGKTSAVRESYNSVRIEIDENTRANRKLFIEARAYNDAVSFRYIVPEQKALSEYRLKNEKTEYRFPTDAMSYAMVLPNFNSGYESEFYKLPVSALANQGGVASKYLIGMPLLLEIPGTGWMAITETDMEHNASAYLCNPSGSWTGHWVETVISPSMTHAEVAVSAPLPHQSPWRVILIAPEPTQFIESNIITSLNPECRISDTSWIKPGKASWDWWCGSLNKEGKSEYSTETMKYYVDFAAESGLEYMLIDAGWSGGDITKYRDNLNVPEVVKYAAGKGIKVFIWAYSKYVWNQMDEAFPLYEQWGVAGVKIDFIERDDQAGIDFYYRVAEKAAQHKLMIDYHGCTKPWGLHRTYPNVVGFEGILGMEQSKAGSRDNPDNHLMIPFTRMLPGLADYTPGGFGNVTKEEFVPRMERPVVMGTRAHHLAMYVVYESPWQMVSDWPEVYRNDPSFRFIQDVPATWDKTKVLNGKPGEYITIARQRGDDWYLGAMTNWTERSFEIGLDFLDSGNYEAEIYADASDSGQNPKNIKIEKRKVTSKSKLKVNMESAGGLAIRFRKL